MLPIMLADNAQLLGLGEGNAIEALTNTNQGANQDRWRIAAREQGFCALDA